MKDKSQIKLNLIVIINFIVLIASIVVIFFILNIQQQLIQIKHNNRVIEPKMPKIEDLLREEEETINMIEQLEKIIEREKYNTP